MNFLPKYSATPNVLVCLGLALLGGFSPLFATEEIRDFSSRIEILPNADIVVTETLRVMPEGQQIRRGIYRDFPTLYTGRQGLRTRVPFEILEILRDGSPEPWHTESRANGIRIYLGRPDVLLPRLETTYTIKYRTGRQLGFFKTQDELYWNVTGNDWAFPILSARACVDLPPGAEPLTVEAYTGPQGGRGRDFRVLNKPGCDAALETTRSLDPGEGLTLVVTWPKGFVEAPSPGADLLALLAANLGTFVGVIGLLAALGYFLVSWALVGRDPARGVIIPQFAPPEGFTPQAVRYLNGLGTCDNTSLSAAILDLAVKRLLTIRESDKREYTLKKNDASGGDAADLRLSDALFGSSTSLRLAQVNHSSLNNARRTLSKDLAQQLTPFFSRNTKVWVIGLLVTLIPLGLTLFDGRDRGGMLFMMVWLSIWSVGCGVLSLSVFRSWKSSNKLAAIPLTLFSIPFFIGWFIGFGMLLRFASPWVCGLYVTGILLCVIFQHLLKRPTTEGQKLRDQILGFKNYLSVAEAERLGLENPPERTPELFEKFLPYALALGVEQAWSEQFADILSAASLSPDSQVRSSNLVLPHHDATSFSSAFHNAISSASVAPGSSSGSSSGGGGGGSSGGGGGGGGGGGW